MENVEVNENGETYQDVCRAMDEDPDRYWRACEEVYDYLEEEDDGVYGVMGTNRCWLGYW